jgi:uncharacterized protein YidB (DUF937 family)
MADANDSAVPPEQHPVVYDEIGKLVAESGGVGGLVSTFESKGLGGVIAGWVSNGPNPPISGEQVIDVVGRDRVAAIAAKAGLSEEQVSGAISQMLPKLVNELTPNGTVPAHSPGALDDALGLLKSRFLGGS